MALALLLAGLAQGCAPTAVQRDGVSVPYEQAADEDLRRAKKALDQGRPAVAIRVLEPFLEELRSSRRADQGLWLLAEAHAQQGDPERAALTLRRLIERHPRSPYAPRARLRAAELYRELGRPEIGRAILRQAAFERAPASLRAQMHRMIADLARAEGDYPEAVLALALSRRDAEDPETLSEIDLELQELVQERLNDAELAHLARRLPRGPVYDRVLLTLAERQLERGDYGMALDTLDRLPQRLRPVDERTRTRLTTQARAGSESTSYRLGLALPLSGPYEGFGEKVLRSVVLALGIFDESPRHYELIVRDTKGDPAEAAEAIHELIGEGVRVILGPLRSVSALAAAPWVERARVPMLTFATRPDVPYLGEYVFRIGLDGGAQASALAQCAIDELDYKTFAVLYPKDDYGRGFKNAFWDQVEERGGEIVGSEGYAPGAVDMQAEIKRLVGLYYMTDAERELVTERDRLLKRRIENEERLADPNFADLPPYVDFDALFVPDAARKVGLILPQLRFYDIRDVTYMGPRDWNDPELLRIAGRDARGSVFVDGFWAADPDPASADFVARYQGAYGDVPDATAASAWDAARLVRSVVENEGPLSARRLRDALLDVRDFGGVSGLAAFDEVGGPLMALQLLTIERGAIREFDCRPRVKITSP
ncbi:MAG: ABC transporter substrate-binding protein [Deltaproteobacteria bacterium]|nr:ABC transporter substrate-binding protein [Deltaproteobacteria bacterium]